jgi:hypothetical protein
MECPVCGAAAQSIDPATFDAKSIRCSACGDYDISGNTWDLELLGGLSSEGRRKALAKARVGVPGHRRPLITSYMIEP